MTTRQTPDAVREAVALLPKLRALLKPATARPWRVFDGGQGLLAIMKGDRPKVRSSAFDKRWKEIVKWAGFDGTDVGKRYDAANGALIVEAVNTLPILLDAIEHLAALDNRAGDAGEDDIETRARAIAQQVVPYQAHSPHVSDRQMDRRRIAKAAARLALSATPAPAVDAVPAGEAEATQTFELRWTGAARPPVHPTPMSGCQRFTSFERAARFMLNQPSDAKFVSLHADVTRRYDRTADMQAALDADVRLDAALSHGEGR